jgi:hypothetical protein
VLLLVLVETEPGWVPELLLDVEVEGVPVLTGEVPGGQGFVAKVPV